MKYIIVLFFIYLNVSGVDDEAGKILNRVEEKLAGINDYQADLEINIDVDFLEVPPAKGTLFFKKPDKMHFKSEKFALIPKEVFRFTPGKLFDGNFDSILAGTDTLDNRETWRIRIIPRDDSEGFFVADLWIDKEKDILLKVESKSQGRGNIDITFVYEEEFPLPTKMEFVFNISGAALPRAITKKFSEGGERNAPLPGKVSLLFRNYKVNEGIDDKIFTEE